MLHDCDNPDEPLTPDLQGQLDNFQSFVDAQIEGVPATELSHPLFHYTHGAGLKGIIEKEQIWLTSVFHLNDPSELSYGLGIARDYLSYVSASSSKPVARLCAGMTEIIQHDFGSMFGFFVGSFRQNKDDLGQWRAYANDGKGYALGIASKAFRSSATSMSKPDEIFWLAPVEYDPAVAKDRYVSAIDHATKTIDYALKQQLITSPEQGRIFLKNISVALATPLIWLSITTKHQAYRHEQEWRLILINDIQKLQPYIQTRVRFGEIVPYVPIGLPLRSNNTIHEIRIGPAAGLEAQTGLEYFLLSNGIAPSGLVTRSEIPYRSL